MAGLDENGFTPKRLDEIKIELEDAVRANLGADLALTPDTVEGQIIAVFSQIYADLWEELTNAYNAFNPLWATGQTLDNLVLLNGLTRLPPASSRALLSVTGVDGTVIPAGSIVKHANSGAQFQTEEDITISATGGEGYAQAINSGPVEALAGTLTEIETPVNGWDTVTNNADAILGRDAETDAELRQRRARSLALVGGSSIASIISAVNGILGVSYAGIAENYTDVTSPIGLPPHSFEVIALGGDDNAIGRAIFENKPVGIEPFGDVSVPVVEEGTTYNISFSRPATVTIWLRATVQFLSDVPDDAADVITQNILDFAAGSLISGQGFSVGDAVIYSRMYMPFNLSYETVVVNSLELSTDGTNWVSADIPIAYNELSGWDASRIAITVG